jgi:autotransporter adhesin
VSNLTGQTENVQPVSDATDVPSASGSDGAEVNAAMPGTGVGSTAAGAGAAASGNYATVIGANASAAADNAVAVGANAAATGVNSTAIGAGSQAANTNSVALGQGSVTDRDNSVSVGSAGNERQITNVAAGTAPTDAVNVGQLNSVRSDMDNFRKDAMGGVASAMALANLPQSVLPGRTMVAMGASTYGGQVGTALGMSYMTRDSKWTVKGAATTSTRGEVGGALSAGFYF